MELVKNQKVRAEAAAGWEVGARFRAVLGVDRHQAPQQPPGVRILDRQVDDDAAVLGKQATVLEQILFGIEREAETQASPLQARQQCAPASPAYRYRLMTSRRRRPVTDWPRPAC